MLLGGWSFALAVLAVPAVLAVAVWLPIARRDAARPDRPAARRLAGARGGTRSPGSSPATMAGTSMMFYGWITWLAPYYERQGWSPQQAGLLLAVWSVAQMPAGLLVPALAERRRRWRFWAGLTLACGMVGTLGAAAACRCRRWSGRGCGSVLIGFGLAPAFPLGLAVIAWRTPDGAASAATSGLALGRRLPRAPASARC